MNDSTFRQYNKKRIAVLAMRLIVCIKLKFLNATDYFTENGGIFVRRNDYI